MELDKIGFLPDWVTHHPRPQHDGTRSATETWSRSASAGKTGLIGGRDSNIWPWKRFLKCKKNSQNALYVESRSIPLGPGGNDVMITPRQVQAGRIMIGMQQRELAIAAEVALSAVARLEQNKADTRRSTLLQIQAALERGNAVGRVEFLPASDGKLEGIRLLPPIAEGARDDTASG